MYTCETRWTTFFALRLRTRSSSRSRRPISTSSRSATSRGERIVQLPVGHSATDRRPSSNAAASRAALAEPTPGIPASSASEARASAPTLACRASASSARSRALLPPEPVPQTTAISSAAESPPGPRRASRSRGRSAAGRSRTERDARRCARASSTRPLPIVMTHLPFAGRRAAVYAPASEASPGPGRRKPADFPRHPDPGTRRRLRGPPYPPLTRGLTGTLPLDPARRLTRSSSPQGAPAPGSR